jgi:quinoprotein glucose dehydrogenase
MLRVVRLLMLTAGMAIPAAAQQRGEWAAYGRDQTGARFSPLTRITRENVGRLTVAWTFRTGDSAVRRVPKFEATPLMVDGLLYLSTPFGRAIALDPVTGGLKWDYRTDANRSGNWGDFASRGVSTWLDARAPAGAPCRRRIYLPVIDGRIVALDAKTGKPCTGFGTGGTVRLRDGLHNTPYYAE